ncbi:homoserine kinase [Candidatus Poriferisocius sp.]|uniref:homoserine kinase n=1 Tax=Candidatus Poriferisocius sp. TaxID=3101276 RepID=UPI003B520AC8
MSTASAPASSANLGPGFDTMALALDLRCQVTATPDDRWSVHHLGPEAYVGDEKQDAVLRAAKAVCTTPLRLQVANNIPVCRGLGSSAAAYTAGALAALRAQGGNPTHDQLFRRVKHLEGHPDNAAAAVYGGLVSVAQGWVVHHHLSARLVPLAAIPGFELRTKDARTVVPDRVPLGVAVRTMGRITALIDGMRTGSPAVLANALGDEIHEVPRIANYPILGRLINSAMQSGAAYACLSGAGPTVLALASDDRASAVMEALEDALGSDGRVTTLAPDTVGAD